MSKTKASSGGSTPPAAGRHPSQLLGWIVVGLVAIFTIGLVSFAAVSGPKLRALATQKAATELDAENDAFCQKFGMSPGKPENLQCKIELTELARRQQEIERSAVNFP